jgi:hypothetical protein
METEVFGVPLSTILEWKREHMNNQVKIKPLMKYELFFDNVDHRENEVFTADGYVQDENSLIFYRTGNIIRQYFYPFPAKIVVTPVDDAELPE